MMTDEEQDWRYIYDSEIFENYLISTKERRVEYTQEGYLSLSNKSCVLLTSSLTVSASSS